MRRRHARQAASRRASRSPRVAAHRRGRRGAAGTPRRCGRAARRRFRSRASFGATTNATSRTIPLASASLSGGTQNAPSTTPSIELSWKSRWPSALRLPATLTRSFERPSRRNVSGLVTSSTSASTVGFGDVAAADRRRGTVAVDAHVVEGAPFGAERGAPGRDLARFGAAVDLEQGRVEPLFGTRGQLRRQRCGGAQHELKRRQLKPGIEHRLQMKRRRHECPRRFARASAATTSAGKNGRSESSVAPPCSASSTLDSKPYMCCGGTVATRSRRPDRRGRARPQAGSLRRGRC